MSSLKISTVILSLAGWFTLAAQVLPVRVIPDPNTRKVDVYIGDGLFTSYLFPENLEKPVLYPVNAPGGLAVTRGFPLEPRVGERTDHPHHVGMWFNYGDVNGIDFWNNSYAVPEKDKPGFGSVVHHEIRKTVSGEKEGILAVHLYWMDVNGKVMLEEETEFRFSGSSDVRRIERFTTLRAAMSRVVLRDNKEGLLAIRMDRAFETPLTEPEILVGPDGKPGAKPVIDNNGVNGLYRNSSGLEGDAVWGQRARWVSLSAKKGDRHLTVAMADHRSNPGYPAHWHARGYGLFSVNNLGSRVFVPNDPQQLFTQR